MALTERERHDAYGALHETVGPRTDIVISMLQPAHDLATKDDLTHLRTELRMEFRQDLQVALRDQTRQMTVMLLGAVVLFILTATLQGALAG